MKIEKIIFGCMLLSALFSCSGGGDDDPTPTPTTKVTYNANVKSIMTNNCISCHGTTPTNSAPMSLTTYAQVKSAVETRGLISRINDPVNPMPQSGLMSQANRTIIQNWVDGGMLEN